MKVLLLSWNFPPTLGGIEYVVDNLFRGLRRKGHGVEVVTTAGLEVPAIPGVFRAGKKGLKAFVWYALTRGFSRCRHERPDLLLCGSVVAAPAAYLLSRWFRIPYGVLVHGSDVLHGGWIYQRAIRFLLQRADLLTTNSAQTQALVGEAGIRTDRSVVVHPGVDVDAFLGVPEGCATELIQEMEGRRVLMTVGRLIKRKGHLEFVTQVMPALVDKFPNILLLVVGEDATSSLVHAGGFRKQIEAQIEALGLQDHVRMLGQLTDSRDLVRLFYRADVFVLPCLDIPGDIEGFGIVFLEAALGGTPSVATRVGGIPEAIIDGETGLLVTPGDFPALTDAVAKLFEEDDLRKRMSEAAENRARNEFAWEVIVDQYVDAFTSCVTR